MPAAPPATEPRGGGSSSTPPSAATTRAASPAWSRSRPESRVRLGDLEVPVAQLERLLDAMLGPRLDEVELAVLEPQVGAKGMDEVARDLLALIALQLLDQPERLLGDHDAVGRHAGDLLGVPLGAASDVDVVEHLGEDPEVRQVAGRHAVAGEQQAAGEDRAEAVEEQVERAERRAEEAGGRHAQDRIARHDRDVRH